jgi:iron-sulfur cluster repair protein YtfE (RIC family)
MTSADKRVSERRATDMLRRDHAKLQKLFADYAGTNEPSQKENIVQTISLEFHLHSILEEQIFFPAIKQILRNDEVVRKAVQELDQAKLVLDKLQRLCAAEDSEEYSRLVYELQKCLERHVEQEEDEMMPTAERSQLDLVALGGMLDSYRKGSLRPAN